MGRPPMPDEHDLHRLARLAYNAGVAEGPGLTPEQRERAVAAHNSTLAQDDPDPRGSRDR